MKDTSFVNSEQFDVQFKASRFVRQRYEPSDYFSTIYVEDVLKELGFDLQDKRPTSQTKYIRCMSDFLECICWLHKRSDNEKLIAWTGTNANYTGGPYSADIARRIKGALTQAGYLSEVQPPSKKDHLAGLYAFDPALIHPDLKFKKHHLGVVEVRKPKSKSRNGQSVRAERMSLKSFRPDVDPIEDDMKKINKMMVLHPLEWWTGECFDYAKRIFNNGSLTSGGRIYGNWQQENEQIRLMALIDGEPVCEIDFKASFLAIANLLYGPGTPLPFDPYEVIPFVGEVHEGRDLAKSLLVSYFGKGGRMTQFPQGRRDKVTGNKISLKEKHRIPKKHNVSRYMDPILSEYPFIAKHREAGVDLMYVESEILTSSILDLVDLGIPSYPVHDCLIVKQSDKEHAVKVLHCNMLRCLGGYIHMDVAFLDSNDEVQEERLLAPSLPKPCGGISIPKMGFTWGVVDDMDLIDEWDIDFLEDEYLT